MSFYLFIYLFIFCFRVTLPPIKKKVKEKKGSRDFGCRYIFFYCPPLQARGGVGKIQCFDCGIFLLDTFPSVDGAMGAR